MDENKLSQMGLKANETFTDATEAATAVVAAKQAFLDEGYTVSGERIEGTTVICDFAKDDQTASVRQDVAGMKLEVK